MITQSEPTRWQELQTYTADILRECGFSVEVERVVETARGTVEIDVYAEEVVDGRRYSIACECKHWRKNVSQSVIHGFRAVIADLGVNVGLIIASSGFQSGAEAAATFTAVELLGWREFQDKYERTWLTRFMQPTVTQRCDPLLTYTEPLLPKWFGRLSDSEKARFIALKERHDAFGWLMMTFTEYTRMFAAGAFPALPLRARVGGLSDGAEIPGAVLDATGYREFLDAALAQSDHIVEQFRALRPADASPSEYE